MPNASTGANVEPVWPEARIPGEISEDEDDEDDEEISPYLDEEPPNLPELPVRFFFPGLVLRVARDFTDAYGLAVSSSDLIRLIDCLHEKGEYALCCLDRTIRLKDEQAEIIANARNAWFQPVPKPDCLEDLLESIERRLGEAEEDEEADPDRIERLREDIERCEVWIAEGGPKSKGPRYRSELAASLFGPDHQLAVWIRLLFAAVQVG